MNQTTSQNAALPGVMQMVLLRESIAFEPKAIEQVLRQKLGSESLVVESAESGESLVVLWGPSAFAVMMIDQPVPTDTFTTALRTCHSLKNGEQLIAEHKAHLIVSPLTDAAHQGQAFMLSLQLMSLADMLSEDHRPLGFFWSSAQALVDPQGYQQALSDGNSAFEKQMQKQAEAGYDLPATYWVGLRLFSYDDGKTTGAISQGLINFLGFELEIQPIAWAEVEVAKRFYGTISYLFDRGPVLQAGNTLGVSESEHFKVSFAEPTETLPRRLVLSLETN